MLWVLNETVLLSTQNTFSLKDKKKVTFLRTKVCLSGAIMLPWGGGGGGGGGGGDSIISTILYFRN